MLYSEFIKRDHFSYKELLGISQGNLVEDPLEEFIRLPAPPMLMLSRVVELDRRGARGTAGACPSRGARGWPPRRGVAPERP